jgi:hypothetical protein
VSEVGRNVGSPDCHCDACHFIGQVVQARESMPSSSQHIRSFLPRLQETAIKSGFPLGVDEQFYAEMLAARTPRTYRGGAGPWATPPGTLVIQGRGERVEGVHSGLRSHTTRPGSPPGPPVRRGFHGLRRCNSIAWLKGHYRLVAWTESRGSMCRDRCFLGFRLRFTSANSLTGFRTHMPTNEVTTEQGCQIVTWSERAEERAEERMRSQQDG